MPSSPHGQQQICINLLEQDVKLAHIPTLISNYSRASSLWAEGLETPEGDGSSFSNVTRSLFPRQPGVMSPCQCRDSKFIDSKRVSSEEIQATISSPSINGNGRHHWSQSISVCCQQIERVWCRTLLVAAELDLLMSPRRQSVTAQTRPLEPPTIIETSQWWLNYQCRHNTALNWKLNDNSLIDSIYGKFQLLVHLAISSVLRIWLSFTIKMELIFV